MLNDVNNARSKFTHLSYCFYVLGNLALAGTYYYTARFGIQLESLNGFITLIWPPSGIALAVLLLFGIRLFPGVFLGALCVEYVTGAPPFSALLMAVGNTLGALVATFFMVRVFGFRGKISKLQEALGLIFVGAIFSTIISAAIGTLSLWTAKMLSAEDYALGFITWWVGDMLGILIVTPFVLSIFSEWQPFKLAKSIEVLILFLVTAVVSIGIFQDASAFSSNLYVKFPYVLFPSVIWAAVRFGIRTTAALSIMIAAVAISKAITGYGPFIGETVLEQLLYLQLFLGVLSATGLILSASITEQNQTAEIVLDSQKHLSAMVNQMIIGIAQTDLAGRFILVNEKFCEIVDLPKNKLLKMRFHDVVHSQDMAKFSQLFSKVKYGGEASVFEQRLVRSEAKEVWVNCGISCVYDHANKPLSAVAVIKDITAHKHAENALIASEERLRLATESTGTGIWDWDVKSDLMKCTDRFRQIFELDQYQEINQAKIMSLIDPKDRDEVYKLFFQTLKNPESCNFGVEFRIRPDRGGQEKWIASRGYTFFDAQGKPQRIIGTALDITAKKRAVHELLKAKEAADKSSKAKSDFLAHVSHEIRTPLGIMIGFSDLLKNSEFSRKDRDHYLDLLIRNGQHLLAIINDLLDLSKIEAGKFNTEDTRFEFLEFLADLSSVLTAKAKAKGIFLIFEHGLDLPKSIASDPVRLRQILMNLIGNAIKFTEKGGVTVKINAEQTEHTGFVQLSFNIADSGCGIALESRERLFQAFSQGDETMTRKFGGTGLGLVLSKQFARFLGGDVVLVESAPDKGSTFLFTVTCRHYPTATAHIVEKSIKLKQRKNQFKMQKNILVVDDMRDNQDLLKHFLSHVGANVDIASDGFEGIKKAIAQDFDLVLMDLQMPGCDGYEATRRLRQNGYKKPIVALTAHAMKSELDDCLKVGCNAHLTKPITLETLLETIEKFC